MTTRRRPSRSPFDALEASFVRLATRTVPMCLNGDAAHRSGAARLSVVELRDLLLEPATPFCLRDALVNEVVSRSKASGGDWTLALAGLLLPGLRRTVAGLICSHPEQAHDIESEALAGMLAEARRVAPGRERVAARLVWAGRHAAEGGVRAEEAEAAKRSTTCHSAEPPKPWGHPDFVLARAVSEGVICRDDASLIGLTRLDGLLLSRAASHFGISYRAVKMRRLRAEARLVSWLRGDFVATALSKSGFSMRGRPRHCPVPHPRDTVVSDSHREPPSKLLPSPQPNDHARAAARISKDPCSFGSPLRASVASPLPPPLSEGRG